MNPGKTRNRSELPLAQQRAVVTGGGRGIGAAIAHELVALGATVTIMGRNRDTLENFAAELHDEYGRRPFAAAVDVTVPDSVVEAFAYIRDRMGDPTILVNNAGSVATGPFARIDLEDWNRMLAVNLTSVFLACREVLPAMLEARAGTIVNVASTAGLEGAAYITAYTAAKHGVVGLTRALAIETASRGITVNAVCPGYTNTDLTHESARKVADKTGRSVDEILAQFAASNAGNRIIEPDEIAGKVAWLCLPEQGAITGQAIVIDGTEPVR